jgi:PAS domain S-box-containing protein
MTRSTSSRQSADTRGASLAGHTPDAEVQSLRERLEEAEETLRAIRSGEVDALVVDGPAGPQIYTLVGADQSYRMLVEQMRDGALMLSTDGTVLYSNARLVMLLGMSEPSLGGRPLADLVVPEDRAQLLELLQQAASCSASGELRMRGSDGTEIPVLVSCSALRTPSFAGLGAIVTDLSDQKRRERAAADERLTRAIVEHAAEPIVVCDGNGVVVRANRIALDLCGVEAVGHPFDEVYPVGVPFEELVSADRGAAREARFQRPDGVEFFLLVNARPVRDAAAGELSDWVVTLADITDRKWAEAERAKLLTAEQAARAEAERANRAKSEFLAVMSHELRTPLNAIAGYAELMQLGVPEPVPRVHQDYLRRIRTAQQHLLTLINSVLSFARLEAGRLSFTYERVPVDELLRAVEPLVAPQMQAKKLQYHCEPFDPGLAVMADPEKAAQILLNLVSNAVKFTPPGGTVSLEAESDEDVVALRVRDTGVGITPDMLASIFEPFVQVDARLTRTAEGVGLGLTISRELAHGMGGDLTAESAPGKGSTFSLTLARA